jgi:two-component system LytT family response regulator
MTAVIIDDELRNRKTLEVLLKQNFPDLKIVGQAANVEAGLEQIQNLKPQIVFLDIEMPDGSGFDLLRKIKEYDFEVIFTTAFDEYAIEAFRYSAIGYLLKPISTIELKQTVKKAIDIVESRNVGRKDEIKKQVATMLENYSSPAGKMHTLLLPDMDGFQVIPLADILYLEGAGNYSKIYMLNDESLLSSHNVGYYEDYLLNEGFFRISRSHIINLSHVSRISRKEGGFVVLNNNIELSLASNRKDDLRKRFE